MVVSSIFQQPINRIEPITRDYVAGDDCQVFINGNYLDQVASLQYQVLNTKKPVYGYHSEFLDGMMIGQETVYGRLVVYKTMSNYLTQIVRSRGGEAPIATTAGRGFLLGRNSYELSFLDEGSLWSIPLELHQLVMPLLGEASFRAYEEILAQLRKEVLPGVESNATIQMAARREKIRIVIAYKRLMAEQINKYYGSMARFWEAVGLTQDKKDSLSSRRTFEQTLDGSDLAMAPFDLSVFMGVEPTQTLGKDYAIVGQLEACHITASNATYTTTAEPLGTSYDFFSRRYTETHVTG